MREISVPNAISESAFASALARVQRPLYTFVRGLTGEDELARDLVQDAFCDAWRAAQRLAAPFTDAEPNGEGSSREEAIRRWLFHAAYCRAVSALRRRRLLSWISLDWVSEPEVEHPLAPDAFEDQVVEGQVLRAALANLSPEDRACLLLNVVQGFTSTEIATIVGLRPETAKKRVTRAKERLRAAYFAENSAAED